MESLSLIKAHVVQQGHYHGVSLVGQKLSSLPSLVFKARLLKRCIPTQAQGQFPLGLGLVVEDES